MDKGLEDVCDALEELSKSVRSQNFKGNTLNEQLGWHSPALTPYELSEMASMLASQIRSADISDIDEDLSADMESVPRKLQLIQSNTVPQFWGGNSPQAIPAYINTLNWIKHKLQPHLYMEVLDDPKAMPPMLAKRLRSLRKQLEEVSVDKEQLLKQIELIQNATETAESLPADLISLKEARQAILDLSSESIKDSSKISELKEASVAHEEDINEKIQHADKLINQCEDAYRITTTKGLAGAFEERATRLSKSMWVWVVGLLVTLSIGAFIGTERLELLTKAMSADKPDIGIIVMQSLLSILSLGAPLWFAWLSTKQIGHRFKLAEDYAFKASVAKAYEGYRKEAARIDEAFEARLFSTALTRVEEAPLRLVNDGSHGSPWHELVSSPEFRSAIDSIPELRDKFIELAKQGIESAKDIKPFEAKKKSQEKSEKEEGA